MKETIGRARCEELAKSSSFYRKVYSEIEEVGWESLRRDKKGRAHILELQLDRDYPNSPPSLSADVPYMFSLEWSTSSRLKDVMHQFQKHLDSLQEFWSVLDDIDKSLSVVDAKQPSRASPIRRILAGKECNIIAHINFNDPKSLPECRFIGPEPTAVNNLLMIWRRNSKKWSKEKSFLENLECILGTELPKPPGFLHVEDDHHQFTDFSLTLKDEELGARSGTRTDYTCENISCNKSFHSLCLTDWLRSITTTRQSFDVLFGNCPYCSDPVAVKINNMNKLD
ncbi:hypothetical protein Bca101_042302 [Brassica carinata]